MPKFSHRRRNRKKLLTPSPDETGNLLKQFLESYMMQQQTQKNFQSVRSHSPANAVLAKGTLTSDDFKFGFPSTGLSAVSYKWWESSNGDDSNSSAEVNAEAKQLKYISKESEKELTSSGKTNETVSNSLDPNLLTAIRKRAVEEGRESLKLGVCKRNAIQKPSSKQKKLLVKIFGSSLPSQWSDVINP